MNKKIEAEINDILSEKAKEPRLCKHVQFPCLWGGECGASCPIAVAKQCGASGVILQVACTTGQLPFNVCPKTGQYCLNKMQCDKCPGNGNG
jgi:hypothetical protein